jgi:hypothetical protein
MAIEGAMHRAIDGAILGVAGRAVFSAVLGATVVTIVWNGKHP